MKQLSIFSFTSLLAVGLSFTVACDEPDSSSSGDDPDDTGGDTAGSTGGSTYDDPIGTGGTSEGPPACEGTPGTRAYLCAGHAYEETLFSDRIVHLSPVGARAACAQSGTSLAQATFPEPMEGEPDIEWQEDPAPQDSWSGTGGSDNFGGASTGGATSASGGGNHMGGAGNGPGPLYDEAWCEEFPSAWLVAGITFSLDDCGKSELALPLRFQEPADWYRMRVYVGESPCERGELVLEQAGYGTGDLLVVDPGTLPAGFVTIELVDEGWYYSGYNGDYYQDDYYWYPYYYGGEVLRLELNDLSRPDTE